MPSGNDDSDSALTHTTNIKGVEKSLVIPTEPEPIVIKIKDALRVIKLTRKPRIRKDRDYKAEWVRTLRLRGIKS